MTTMLKLLVSALVLAAPALPALASPNTRVDFQVSLDNAAWSTSVAASPGQQVFVRTLVTYTGTAAPLGLANMIFQPTVENYLATDTLSPFVSGGLGSNTSTPLGVVTNVSDPNQFGRVSPWGRSALSATTAAFGHTHTGNSGGAPNGDWLRIAQLSTTAWIGQTGNTTGGGGIPISQLSDVGRTAADPAFNSSLTGIEVFRFGITVGAGHQSDMTISADPAGFGNRNVDTGDREVYWFASLAEVSGSIRGTAEVNPAFITTSVPSPAAAGVLALAGLTATRRRRGT